MKKPLVEYQVYREGGYGQPWSQGLRLPQPGEIEEIGTKTLALDNGDDPFKSTWMKWVRKIVYRDEESAEYQAAVRWMQSLDMIGRQ